MRNVVNALFKVAMELREKEIGACLEMMEILGRYGSNIMTVDFFFAYLIVAH